MTLLYRGKPVEIVSPRPRESFYDFNVRIIKTGAIIAVRKHELLQKD